MILAYLDPATGAMVLQIIVAAVVGVGVFFRRYLISPMAYLFGKNRAGDSSLSAADDNES